MSASPAPTRVRHPRRSRAVVLLAVVLLAGGAVTWQRIATRHDRRAAVLLASTDPADRAEGARLIAAEDARAALDTVVELLPSEPDAVAREAYVYALGHAGNPQQVQLITPLVENDPDPYVRHGAWLAIARLDPAAFRRLEQDTPPGPAPWDEIGRAYGWLEVGRTDGVPTLLHWAADGSPNHRRGAAAALYRGVAPLLEAVGRWPLHTDVDLRYPWPPAVVDEVARRCEGLDLQAIMDHLRPHVARGAQARRDAGKLQRARERLTWALFGAGRAD
jgi:hypothetical protein